MLPDFPETKKLFSRSFNTYMRQTIREVSPYGIVPTRILYEGRAMKITRADLSESTYGMEQLAVRGELTFDEIENLTLEKTIEKLDAIIVDLVQKQIHFVRERLSSEIPESQTLDVKGRRFDAQLVIDMLETMQVDFYPDGTPHHLFMDPPLPPERAAALKKEIESNPEVRRKLDEVMGRKKEEWRAREADRKLVG